MSERIANSKHCMERPVEEGRARGEKNADEEKNDCLDENSHLDGRAGQNWVPKFSACFNKRSR